MDDRLRELERRIESVEWRNARVEADKAWETSWFRVGSIAVATYVIVVAVLLSIGAANPLLSALVPAIGYLLSTQTIPVLKRWWLGKKK